MQGKCPKCESNNLENLNMDLINGEVVIYYECRDCGIGFDELYLYSESREA
jgi:predicted Zn-ribbon and HTH transcriptional regulator